MKRTNTDRSDNDASRDFAIVDIESSRVMLEANEWDWASASHRKVVLVMHPMEAKLLAGQLQRNAKVAEAGERQV